MLNFGRLTNQIRVLSGWEESASKDQAMTRPNIAIKMGQMVNMAISVLQSEATIKGDGEVLERAKRMSALFQADWKDFVGRCANVGLKTQRMTKKFLLPNMSDIGVIDKQLRTECEELTAKLKDDQDLSTFKELTSLTLAYVVFFNKRRTGETSKMTIKHYEERERVGQSEMPQEFLAQSAEHQVLAQKFHVATIPAKKHNKGYVILDDVAVSAIGQLLATRRKFVHRRNEFLFPVARIKGEKTNISACKALRKAVDKVHQKVPLFFPERITGTNLRKTFAYCCQYGDYSTPEIRFLCQHMGHSEKIHQQFYRAPAIEAEVTQMSRLLVAFNRNVLMDFAGQKLSAITLEKIEELAGKPILPAAGAVSSDNFEGSSSPSESGKCFSYVYLRVFKNF